jgi:hypothetical protein
MFNQLALPDPPPPIQDDELRSLPCIPLIEDSEFNHPVNEDTHKYYTCKYTI